MEDKDGATVIVTKVREYFGVSRERAMELVELKSKVINVTSIEAMGEAVNEIDRLPPNERRFIISQSITMCALFEWMVHQEGKGDILKKMTLDVLDNDPKAIKALKKTLKR